MKTFKDWSSENRFVFENGFNLYQLAILRIAYESGWNACRDKWGGMEYEETLKWK